MEKWMKNLEKWLKISCVRKDEVEEDSFLIETDDDSEYDVRYLEAKGSWRETNEPKMKYKVQTEVKN